MEAHPKQGLQLCLGKPAGQSIYGRQHTVEFDLINDLLMVCSAHSPQSSTIEPIVNRPCTSLPLSYLPPELPYMETPSDCISALWSNSHVHACLSDVSMRY